MIFLLFAQLLALVLLLLRLLIQLLLQERIPLRQQFLFLLILALGLHQLPLHLFKLLFCLVYLLPMLFHLPLLLASLLFHFLLQLAL